MKTAPLMRRAAAAAALTLAATAGFADGYEFGDSDEFLTPVDLGSVSDLQTCKDQADAAFHDYGRQHSLHSTIRIDEAVLGFDLKRDAFDAIIVCSPLDEGAVRATLVIYSPEGVNRSETLEIRDAIEAIFKG
jgi:hypothetical protein